MFNTILEIAVALLFVYGIYKLAFSKDTPENTVANTNKSTTPSTASVVEPSTATVVEDKKEPAKCGCGRSSTGFCVGLHKLTDAEWAVHPDNPAKVAPEVVSEVKADVVAVDVKAEAEAMVTEVKAEVAAIVANAETVLAEAKAVVETPAPAVVEVSVPVKKAKKVKAPAKPRAKKTK